MIASSGPDRDWDVELLPGRETVPAGRFPSYQMVTIPGEIFNVISSDPAEASKSREHILKFLSAYNVAQYDPTNGSHSDGDLIFIGRGSPDGLLLTSQE
jgi:hypothetical protein